MYSLRYDNGVPIIESPWERVRFEALDVWGSNGTLDGTLSWYVNRLFRGINGWFTGSNSTGRCRVTSYAGE
jgi:hypothetical protein